MTAVIVGPRDPRQLEPARAALGLELSQGERGGARVPVPGMILVLSEADVERLLPMEACIEVMSEALAALARGEMYQPLRSVVRPPDGAGFIGLMPAHRAVRRQRSA